MAKVVKKRNWAFVLYLESAPSDWREQLQQTGLPCAISPYHDQDLDEGGNGSSLKKPHYHIILCYPGPTTYNVVRSLTERLNQPIPIALDSVKGYYRYFTHMDNPDKFQYDERGIEVFNGFNILDYIDLSRSEVTRYKQQIHRLIIDMDILEYSELMKYLLVNEMTAEYDIASSNTLFFDKVITSRRHIAEKGKSISSDRNSSVADPLNVDPDTGEVLM